ncbi:hypothetical protein [Alcaligenes parafaecalis]|uniref:YncE family protein n=1 Tax=Alcaligenes parafaecalis TaxID=171260 RepID=A0ABT3VJ09_9BURK|nr:hypothetical protein [Alcaligenes parafaecalis]MCX5463492.1 hypothetical protein [Alcaligenes parafaecalis]
MQVAATSAVSTPVSEAVLQREVAPGIYELVYSPISKAVFVTSTEEVTSKGEPVHTRQIVVDEAANQIIVSGVTDLGFIWVIDGKTFSTNRILRDIEAPTAGLTLDAANHRLLASGTAAYAVFDTQSWELVGENRIPEKLSLSDIRRRFLVNTALDGKSERLFANQLNNNEGTLVFDLQAL